MCWSTHLCLLSNPESRNCGSEKYSIAWKLLLLGAWLPYPLSSYCRREGHHHPYMGRMVHSIQHLLGPQIGPHLHRPCKSQSKSFPTQELQHRIKMWASNQICLHRIHCPLKRFQDSSPTFNSVHIKFICPVNTLSEHKGWLHLRSAHFCIHGRRVNLCCCNRNNPHLVKILHPVKNILNG